MSGPGDGRAGAGPDGEVRVLAEALVRELVDGGATVAVAESLTGGLVAAALTDVPGASAAFRGGVVAYATDLKHRLLDVPSDALARDGAVHPRTAAAMAAGVRRRLGATWGLATTGVAGPEPQDGRAVGTVHVAVEGPAGGAVRSLNLPGNRADVRSATRRAALDLLLDALRGQPATAPAVNPVTALAAGGGGPRSGSAE